MMQNSKSASQSSSENYSNRPPSAILSEYEYVGRLITRERPIVRKSSSTADRYYYYSTSSDEDADDLSKPLGIIRISDRHVREIYRVPTPPPEIKRVFHRLRSPKPKIIERVFVHRPPSEIIENVIEVPPEKVRIINREKHLRQSKPIIRTKVVHLKPHHHHQYHRSENQQPTATYDCRSQTNPPLVDYTQSINPQPTYYTYSPSSVPSNYFSKYSQY